MNNHRLIFTSLMLMLLCSSFVSCSKDNDDEQSSVYAEFSSLFQKTDYYNARIIVNGMSSQPQLYADNAQAYVETMGNSVA